MKVREVMTSEVEICDPGHDLAAAAMIMWRRDCGAVPVVEPESNRALGVITDRDICMALATRHRQASGAVLGSPVALLAPSVGAGSPRAAVSTLHRPVTRSFLLFRPSP